MPWCSSAAPPANSSAVSSRSNGATSSGRSILASGVSAILRRDYDGGCLRDALQLAGRLLKPQVAPRRLQPQLAGTVAGRRLQPLNGNKRARSQALRTDGNLSKKFVLYKEKQLMY